MKIKLSLLLFTLCLIYNCSSENSSDNEDSSNSPIVGEWQLNKRNRAGIVEIDYNAGDVTYKFNANGTLEIVSTISDYESETLDYELVFDCIINPGCPSGDQPTDVLILNNSSRNDFSINGNEMIFGKAYVDGWNFYLVRIP